VVGRLKEENRKIKKITTYLHSSTTIQERPNTPDIYPRDQKGMRMGEGADKLNTTRPNKSRRLAV